MSVSDIGHLWNQLVTAVERLRVLEQGKAFYGVNASADLIMEYNRTAKFVLGLEEQLGIPQVDSSVTEVKIAAQEAAREEYARQNANYAAEQARQRQQQHDRFQQGQDQAAIKGQFDLLNTARRTLGYSLQQAKAFGGEAFVPPYVNHQIADSRNTIRQCKKWLRSKNVFVDDMPGD